jgi:hypothetical protein
MAITDILPQTVSPEHIENVDLLTVRLIFSVPAKKWIWKIGKVDLPPKSQRLDCGITSVLSPQYVCWQFQPTERQHSIKIERKCMKRQI